MAENLIKPDYFRGDTFKEMNCADALWKCPDRPILGKVNGVNHGSEHDTTCSSSSCIAKAFHTPGIKIQNWATSYLYMGNWYARAFPGPGARYSCSLEPPDPSTISTIRPRKSSEDGKLVLFADIVSWNASFQTWEINHPKDKGNGPVEIDGGNIFYVDGHGHWQGPGHYPMKLIPGGHRDDASAVHNPNKPLFYHKYWW